MARPHSATRAPTARTHFIDNAASTSCAACATSPFRFVFHVSQFAFQIFQSSSQLSLLLLVPLSLHGSFAPLVAEEGSEFVNDAALLRLGLQGLMQLPL